jgi:putative intracellular protease/amidase
MIQPTAPEVSKAEEDLVALRPPKRPRPIIAVVGANEGTETTDYLMTLGILRRSGVADVRCLATGPGSITLTPALRVEPESTVAEFDADCPEGADFVMVPAVGRANDPVLLDWIRSQHESGAMVVGICEGALVLAEAGLLSFRRATTHWYFVGRMRKKDPSIRYVKDRRFIVDGRVATTTGITGSIPTLLTLIEAIAGRASAEESAGDLGVRSWNADHDSNSFRLTLGFASTVTLNRMRFWNHRSLALELIDGIDEVSLALVTDCWSRTYRSHVVAVAPQVGVRSASGLRILADCAAAPPSADKLPPVEGPPVQVLNETLEQISERFGMNTASAVALQLEYTWKT